MGSSWIPECLVWVGSILHLCNLCSCARSWSSEPGSRAKEKAPRFEDLRRRERGEEPRNEVTASEQESSGLGLEGLWGLKVSKFKVLGFQAFGDLEF